MDTINYSKIKKVETDLVAHKEEYTTQRATDQFKVATVEKGLNDYKSTMANVNVNQESKQKVTGYGTISLPKNTANGQVSVSVKGRTATNLVKNGNFANGATDWSILGATVVSTSNNELVVNTSAQNNRVQQTLSYNDNDVIFRSAIVKATSNLIGLGATSNVFKAHSGGGNYERLTHRGVWSASKYISVVDTRTSDWNGFSVKEMMAINLTQTFGAGNEPTVEQCDKMFANYFEGTKSTVSASRLKSVGKNLLDVKNMNFFKGIVGGDGAIIPPSNITFSKNGNQLIITNLTTTGEQGIYSDYFAVRQGIISVNTGGALNQYLNIVFYTKNKQFISRVISIEWTSKAENIPVPINAYYAIVNFRINPGTFTLIPQIEQGTIATPYEPYIQSTQYLPNVGELRSLPNGTKDEVRVSGGKSELVKRVSNETLINNVTFSSSAFGTSGGTYYLSTNNPLSNGLDTYSSLSNKTAMVAIQNSKIINIDTQNTTTDISIGVFSGKLWFLMPISLGTQTKQTMIDYLAQYPITLTYQLAEPIITPIQTSGNLISYPSGTVYVENVVADAGNYTTKFDIKELQLPIKSINKLIKYNFTTGVQTVLDTSLAVINADKKSFTHPNLTNKDMVFVDYYYDVESTLGETTIEYLDSRHTIKDSVLPNKFYKWDIKSANGVPTVTLTEVL